MSNLTARVAPDLALVWQWFEFQLDLLVEARGHVGALGRAGAEVSSLRSYDERFVGQTLDQISAFFAIQRAELESLTIFELLASVEAVLRLDFYRRVTERRKDRVARKFRSLRHPSRVRLDEDILEIWSTEATVKVSKFRGLLKLRHWLAHGRYWLNSGKTTTLTMRIRFQRNC